MSQPELSPKIWNPYDILNIKESATEKEIKSHYKRLSLKFHPDKIRPDPAKNQTIESLNDYFVELTKAYKALTDEEIRTTIFNLDTLMVNRALASELLCLPGLFLRETENMLSSGVEYKQILKGHKADSGLGKLESRVLADGDGTTAAAGLSIKDKTKLEELDGGARRKALALLWAYLGRTELEDSELNKAKYEVAPIAHDLNNAFTAITLAFATTVEKAFFKVTGEKFITPSSLVSFVVKGRFIPPGSENVPEVNELDLEDIDPDEDDLDAILGRAKKPAKGEEAEAKPRKDASKALEIDAEDDISEPDEDSLAGQNAGHEDRRPPKKKKQTVQESSDEDSNTDEEVDEQSETDTDTDEE
ncbi:hypothetical protein DID88_006597 [Monilinia fructigena]|uniref:J domain-containing protein n=1 Tax=Monilinia fructigena TaxID=38457 RepID=A0A395IGN8_9HELO|nr:hypothetical protein DID88_006597 [Monilinia fructigena]